jgi:tRNA (cmo5U34)-methyltransferase
MDNLTAHKASSFLIGQGCTEQEAEQQVSRYGREFFPITAEDHLAALTQTGFSVVELFWYSQMQAGFYVIRQAKLPSTYPDI